METTQAHEGSAGKTDLDKAALLCDKLMHAQGLVSADQVCQDNEMAKINYYLQERKEHVKASRTATTWLQYRDMDDILCKYILAEHTGNWELHLQAVSEMLPYLAASGLNNYTKSALIYLYSKCLIFEKIIQRCTSTSKMVCM